MPQTLQVSPTRMELLKQKQRLKMARRAHDLLEDKRDELMQRFFPLLKEVRGMRKEIKEKVGQAYADLQISKSLTSEAEVEECIMWPTQRSGLDISGYTMMKAPEFKLVMEGDLFCYGLHGSNWKLDFALRSFPETLHFLVELAQREEDLNRLAREIERTRRRVNALEHILIPRIQDAVKYITMKLEERERAHIINLMKMKEIAERGEQTSKD
ncbi:V-type ATP synthase subunit D [Candidatus Aerophobetes bacterium]|uniref:V-type ATP synthase subunit D n=1 Tax=Aerophobetes bacterium TaxID=2030807 RepID=A0A523QKP8_UNCAE|nr:MAG: V-type ATP synthase subunit D [Candidatus Aerophobetes bacterium]